MIKIELKGKQVRDNSDAYTVYRNSFSYSNEKPSNFPYKHMCSYPTYYTIPLWYELNKASHHLPCFPRMALQQLLYRTPGIMYYSLEKNWGVPTCTGRAVFAFNASKDNGVNYYHVGEAPLRLTWYYFYKHGIMVFRFSHIPENRNRTEEDVVQQYFLWDGEKMYLMPNTHAVAMTVKLLNHKVNANWLDPQRFSKYMSNMEKVYRSIFNWIPMWVNGRFPCIMRARPVAAYYELYPKIKEEYYGSHTKRRNGKRTGSTGPQITPSVS